MENHSQEEIKVKDREVYQWLYKYAKPQLIPSILLILGNIFLSGCGVLFALSVKGVIDGAGEKSASLLIEKSLILLGVVILQSLLRIYCRSAQVRIQGKLEINFKTGFLNKILKKNYSSLSAYHSGDFLNRLTGDVMVVSEGMTTLLPTLAGLGTKLISAFLVLCFLDLRFTLVFLIIGISLFFVTGIFRKKIKEFHKSVQKTDGEVKSFLQELLENILVIKTFGAEEKMEEKSLSLQKINYTQKLKRSNISILANTGFTFIFDCGYVYALIWSAYGLIMGTLSFGSLTAILQLVTQVQTPFTGLSGLAPKFYGILASGERIMEIEKLEDEEGIDEAALEPLEIYEKLLRIDFKNILFSYDREIIFDHTNFSINPGDFVLISGLSGIGKSTLLKLMMGVFLPGEGEILLSCGEGEKISVDRRTRGLFAYVPQGHFLLSGTIRENIQFVNENASEEKIIEAARLSCALEFIKEFPQGLDTIIGEKGQGLSEGQMQRLAIARALLSEAPILLLDEVTSALDRETEERVLLNIKKLKNKTCLIVTHKTAALSVCNKIIHISKGKIRIRENKNEK